ncbi:methyl-accepting chemotaxis protein, partial [Dyella silvatica]|uniref:methyl-accepting chemotaxis protein n=1 Tax=Dyella silvatica TaxID=2992128 RepID=UPI00224E7143
MRSTLSSSRLSRLMPSPSLRLRLILRLLGLLLLLLLIGGAAVIALAHADRRMSGLVSNALSPVAAVGRIQNDYNDSLNALTHASLTRLPSAVDEAKTLIQSNRLEIERHWKTLQASGLGQQQAQLLGLADVHRKAAEQVMDEAIKLLEGEQFDLAQLQVASDVQPSFAPLHADFANLFAKAWQTGDDAAAAEHVTSRRTLGYLLALLLIGLLTAVAVDSLLIRTITRRLRQAVHVAQRIAAGDLGHRYATGSADEIGSLLRALQQMEGRLCMVVGDVQRGAERVHAAADQLAQGNDALSKRTQAQAAGLEQASSSMAQMTHAVQRNADGAIRANQLASAAREQARQGNGMVTETMRSMSAIGEAAQRMADIIGSIDT